MRNRMISLRVLPFVSCFAILVCVGLAMGGEPAGGPATWARQEDATALMAEIRDFFAGAESRMPGSKGNLAMEAKVAKIFAASGVRSGEIQFRAPSFVPGKARLVVEGHDPFPLFAMHPTLVRPGNLKERDVETDLVYLGKGSIKDLAAIKGQDLANAVVVLEYNAEWLHLFRYGVRAVLFIGEKECSAGASRSKVHASEVATPPLNTPSRR